MDEWRWQLPLMENDRKGNRRNRCQCKLEFIKCRKLMRKSKDTREKSTCGDKNNVMNIYENIASKFLYTWLRYMIAIKHTYLLGRHDKILSDTEKAALFEDIYNLFLGKSRWYTYWERTLCSTLVDKGDVKYATLLVNFFLKQAVLENLHPRILQILHDKPWALISHLRKKCGISRKYKRWEES